MHVHRRTHPKVASGAALVTAAPVGGARTVRAAELREARAAVAKLPAADRALLSRSGLRVELVPKSSLEDGMLGATTIVRGDGDRWVPTAVQVASRLNGLGRESLAEVVQHELGHAISVLRRQDRTEDAAEAYARRW